MPRADGSGAFDKQGLLLERYAAGSTRTGDGPVTGILIAVGSSLLLWAGLAQVARWVAHAFL